MAVKAQAVIIDAFLLFILCSFAATFLLWASSVYGNKSLRAYTYLYEGEYETSLINVLSEMKYNVSDVPRHWIDEVGYYMNGEFDESSDRYTNMTKYWDIICLQAPVPLQLEVVTNTKNPSHSKMIFNCSLDPTRLDRERINESVQDYMTRDCNPPGICRPPPPYYSSGSETRLCGDLVCKMEAKIYY
ncbi:MAG: hypothetical protein J7L23_03280 [Candidatus Diapherotrites archaeon]|nr:hypothetical protein [Candidatus Diapherotrites archaeon]